jgi:hypothetical protein
MIFRGVITEDGKYFLPDSKREWEAHKQSLAGYEVEVDLWKRRAKRSLQQNRWMHSFLRPLSEVSGVTVPRLKLLGLIEVFGCDKIGDVWVANKTSTTECDTQEMGDLCEWFVQHAAEQYNLVILYPDEFKAKRKKAARKAA